MSWIKKTFGLDAVDLTIHAAVTGCLMVLGYLGTDNGTGPTLVLSASLVLLGVRRHLARNPHLLQAEGTGDGARVLELEERLLELEQAQSRLLELEERLDFTERLLAQQRDPARIEEGR